MLQSDPSGALFTPLRFEHETEGHGQVGGGAMARNLDEPPRHLRKPPDASWRFGGERYPSNKLVRPTWELISERGRSAFQKTPDFNDLPENPALIAGWDDDVEIRVLGMELDTAFTNAKAFDGCVVFHERHDDITGIGDSPVASR